MREGLITENSSVQIFYRTVTRGENTPVYQYRDLENIWIFFRDTFEQLGFVGCNAKPDQS
jgi:hypothetical protein